jgi:hypothetical protein
VQNGSTTVVENGVSLTRDTLAMKADRSRVRKPKKQPGTHPDRAKLALIGRDQLDGRTSAVKVFDALVAAIEADLGGHDALSAIEIELIEAFAGASVLVRNFNASIVLDRAIDIGDFGYIIGAMTRVSARLGEQRRLRVVNGAARQHHASPMRADLADAEHQP